MSFIESTGDGVRLRVRVTPKAKAEGIGGIERDAAGVARLKVRVSAAPEDGKANARVIELLAKAAGQPKSAFRFVSGEHHRNKVLVLRGDPDELTARFTSLAGELL